MRWILWSQPWRSRPERGWGHTRSWARSGPAGWVRSIARGTPASAADVAVKVLPVEVSHTPERLHRFEQEATASSSSLGLSSP